MSEDRNLEPRLHSLCVLQGGEGGAEDFWGDLECFLEQDKEDLPKILTDGEGLQFFSPLIKKEALFLGFFYIKKGFTTLCLKKVS